MHCFSGDADFARSCVERGYWLSFPGVITYQANHYLRDALAVTPAERVLVETDAPYLTPVPARGRPNASYLLPHTVRFLAERRGWDLERACAQLTANAEAAFGGPWGRDA
jgi:TatD DNase family protein